MNWKCLVCICLLFLGTVLSRKASAVTVYSQEDSLRLRNAGVATFRQLAEKEFLTELDRLLSENRFEAAESLFESALSEPTDSHRREATLSILLERPLLMLPSRIRIKFLMEWLERILDPRRYRRLADVYVLYRAWEPAGGSNVVDSLLDKMLEIDRSTSELLLRDYLAKQENVDRILQCDSLVLSAFNRYYDSDRQNAYKDYARDGVDWRTRWRRRRFERPLAIKERIEKKLAEPKHETTCRSAFASL